MPAWQAELRIEMGALQLHRETFKSVLSLKLSPGQAAVNPEALGVGVTTVEGQGKGK